MSLTVALSVALYVFRLGFYSDDWSFLGHASTGPNEAYLGVLEGMVGDSLGMRPVQFLHLAALIKVFGMDPTGYHIVNMVVFLSGIVLFYLVLREFDQPRGLAVALPVVYALLPHYHSDLMWIAAFQAVISMTFYFLSLYGDLLAARTGGRRFWGWKGLAILSMLVSILAYETFLPLFLLNPILVWYFVRRRQGLDAPSSWNWGKHVFYWGGHLAAFAGAVTYKYLSTTRMAADDSLAWHLGWFYRLIKKSIEISYLEYGFGYPARMVQIAQHYFDWRVLVLGLATGLFIFGYLYSTARGSWARAVDDGARLRMKSIAYVGLGIVVFLAGYSIFLTNYNAIATSTGIANRIAIAAGVGVALTYVGGAGWVSSWPRSKPVRAACFSFFIALLCTSGFVINNTVATFWEAAYHEEQALLNDLFDHLPDAPEERTIMLDRMCPYVGPAVVFESYWDLRGALMTKYGTREVRADVVTPATRIEKDGFYTLLYGSYSHYPYDEGILIYNVEQGRSYSVSDSAAARRYFQTHNPGQNSDCPEGVAGVGVRIF